MRIMHAITLLLGLHLGLLVGCSSEPPPAAPPQPQGDVAAAPPPPPPAPEPPPAAAPGYAPPAAAPEPPPAAAAGPQGPPGPAPAVAPHTAAKSAPAAKALPPPAPAKAPPPGDKSAKAAPEAAAQGVPAVPVAPLLIYVGDLQMQVDEAETAPTLDRVIDVAEALGGYLAGRKDTSVQVRVPSQRFRESLVKIEKLGDVMHRSVTADDVSEQYSDLEVRLINLKATRQRLQEFLGRATTMADMLTVAHELDKVAAEIEQIEGKMRYLRSRAAFSLITVTVSPRPKTPVKIVETPPPPRDVELPIDWLSRVGIGRLLDLRSR
jgi:hypothetical protein